MARAAGWASRNLQPHWFSKGAGNSPPFSFPANTPHVRRISIQRPVSNDKDLEQPTRKVNRRNIPVHIVFWLFVLLLLYLFYRAFSG